MKEETLGDIKAREYEERNRQFQEERDMNFEVELNSITDERIRELTKECLNRAPLHFWYMSASSTGKYHARDENEAGGLVLHSKRVAKVAECIIESWPNPINLDVIRSASILHDTRRHGSGISPSKWSHSNHPKLGADLVQLVAEEMFGNERLWDQDRKAIDLISACIASHMGKWGQYPIGSQEALIVHLADAIAANIYPDMDK